MTILYLLAGISLVTNGYALAEFEYWTKYRPDPFYKKWRDYLNMIQELKIFRIVLLFYFWLPTLIAICSWLIHKNKKS